MLAIISIIIEYPDQNSKPVNAILSEHAAVIRGRMGIPFSERNLAVISLTVDCELDLVNSITGRIGRLPSVSAKAVFAPSVKA